MDAATLTLVLTLAVASILMVLAMVRFSASIVAEPQGPSVKRWGLIYAAAWGVLVIVMLLSAIVAGATWPQALAVVTLAVGGWGAFHALWVWLWLSIERTNAQVTGRAGTLTPAKEKIQRRAGQLAVGGLIAVGLAVIELGYLQAAFAGLVAPGHRTIAAMLTVATVGFGLLLLGGMRLVFRRGEPMSHTEIEEDLRRTKYEPQGQTGLIRFGRSTYRHFGPAEGAKAEQEVSIIGIKEAWRSGEWRRDPTWRTVFIMTTGGLMMTYGGFGAAVVVGGPVAKVLFGGALGYTTFQLVAAVRRA